MDIITQIYLFIIVLITFIVCCMYITDNKKHKQEFIRIGKLEKKYKEDKDKMKILKSQTIPCHINNLNSPRLCFTKSNYDCTWNENINRCDQS
jgi:hypothetical protein